jgi:hypothetical protein
MIGSGSLKSTIVPPPNRRRPLSIILLPSLLKDAPSFR